MKKLTRNWRKAHEDSLSLPTRDSSVEDSRPMDTEEQEQLVRSLESLQARHSLLWRSIFSTLLACYAVFLVYSAYQQSTSPWELRYHAYFMEDIDSWVVLLADWIGVCVCSLAVMGMLHNSKHHRRWIWYSCFPGLVLAIFWLYYMLRLPRFRWDVIWLPFGPLGGAGICLYIDHLLNESSEERYHAYFMEDIDSWVVLLADWIGVCVCSLAVMGMLHNSKHHRRWIWYSCFPGLVLAIFWLYYMLRLPRFRWDVIWLPFGPLGGAGICLYIDHLLNESSEERYHAYFMEDIDSWVVLLADWIGVCVCSLAVMGMLHNSKHHRRWIWYSCFPGLVLAIFWLYYMLRLPRFRWDVIWLPFGPLGGAGICLYIDHLLNESSEERYHAYFMEDIDSWVVLLADWIGVCVCSLAVMGMLHNSKHHRRWIWYSCFPGLVLAIFWLYYMLRLPRFRWDVIWLPFGPLGGAGICLYIDHLLNESSEEVRKLRGYMYAFKTS